MFLPNLTWTCYPKSNVLQREELGRQKPNKAAGRQWNNIKPKPVHTCFFEGHCWIDRSISGLGPGSSNDTVSSIWKLNQSSSCPPESSLYWAESGATYQINIHHELELCCAKHSNIYQVASLTLIGNHQRFLWRSWLMAMVASSLMDKAAALRNWQEIELKPAWQYNELKSLGLAQGGIIFQLHHGIKSFPWRCWSAIITAVPFAFPHLATKLNMVHVHGQAGMSRLGNQHLRWSPCLVTTTANDSFLLSKLLLCPGFQSRKRLQSAWKNLNRTSTDWKLQGLKKHRLTELANTWKIKQARMALRFASTRCQSRTRCGHSLGHTMMSAEFFAKWMAPKKKVDFSYQILCQSLSHAYGHRIINNSPSVTLKN